MVLHVALSIVYAVTVPLWEAHDELAHYRYLRYIAVERSLPSEEDVPSLPGEISEISQPPLYYLLAALSVLLVDSSDFEEPVSNPHVMVPGGGVNMFVHTEREELPYHGTALAVHLARLVSIAIGTITVWVTYRMARMLLPSCRDIALGAMAIVAFSPQFLFINSVITNDSLAILMASVILYFALRIVVRDTSPIEFLGLGGGLGLALLTKYNTLALVPLVIVVLGVGMWRMIRHGTSISRPAIAGLLFVSVVGLTGGLWAAHSAVLAGSPTSRYPGSLEMFLSDLAHPISALKGLAWNLLPRALKYGFVTFWASFGWGNLGVAPWIYWALALLCMAATIGSIIYLWRSPRREVRASIFVMAFAVVSVVAGIAYRELRVSSVHLRGRYLLIVLSAVSLLLSIGLSQLAPKRYARIPLYLVSIGMFILGAVIPFCYIVPAYAKPPILQPDQPIAIENQLAWNYGDRMELLGYNLDAKEAAPRREVSITLFWRCLSEMVENYTVSVQILGPDYEVYGAIHSYPGEGNYATSLWKVGEVIQDTYRVRISRDFPAPAFGQVKVAVFPYPTLEELEILDTQGATALGITGRFRVAPSVPIAPRISHWIDFQLGGGARLIGYDVPLAAHPGDTLQVVLYWQALEETDLDYTVFVHLLDMDGTVWAGYDIQPRSGYYPTSLWRGEEIVEDRHVLPVPIEVPSGIYSLRVGMYQPSTGVRLAAFDEAGLPLANDEIPLTTIQLIVSPEEAAIAEAIVGYREAIEQNPESPWAYTSLGDIYRSLNRLDEAEEQYLRAIELTPDAAAAHQGLGDIYRARGRIDDAIAEYERAVRIAPDAPWLYIAFGDLYREQGRWDDAEAMYRQAIALDREIALAHHGLGIVYQNTGRLEDAVVEFRTSIELEPNSPWSYCTLGDVYRALERFEEAAAMYHASIEIDPQVTWPHYGLASIYEARGDIEAAIEEYRRALEVDPTNDAARRALSRLGQ